MTRTLRPRNLLQKRESFSFDKTPSRKRCNKSTGKKTGELRDGKVLSGNGDEEGLRVTTTDTPSSELISELTKEQKKEEDKTKKKGRPRKRPRGRPKRKNEETSLLPTDKEGKDVNSSQDAVKKKEENCNLSPPVVGKRCIRKNDLGEEWLTKSADIDDDGDDASRKPTTSRKRKRQDDDGIIEVEVVGTEKEMTPKQSKHSKKLTEKDYLEFKEVIAFTEADLEQNKTVVCPSCKMTKSRSLPNLLHHLKYACPNYINKTSYHCTLCNRKCRSSATLEQHIKTVHSKNNSLQIKSPETLTRFEFIKLRKQQGGRVKCPNPDCERTFTTGQGMQYHVPRCGVDIEATFKCEYCTKAYKSQPGLSSHIITRHSQPKVPVSSSQEGIDPMRKRGAAEKALKKFHQIAVEGDVEESSGNDNEILSEMAACRKIKELFRSPTKYNPTPAELASWQSEVEQSRQVSCPFCKKSSTAVKFIRIHITDCKSRPGREPFCCLTCKAEFNSRPQILKHLKASHRKLVVATLEKASKDEENKWEAASEDGQDEEDEEEDEEFKLEEEEAEEEEEEELVEEEVVENEQKKKTKRYRNRFDGTRIDDAYRHVLVQVKKATEWTKQFRSKHYCSKSRTLFPDCKVDISKWKALSESVAAAYHPLTKESAMFVIEKRKGRLFREKTETVTLPLYGALPVEKATQEVTFFVGGPVWAMSWCPVPDDDPLARSYVALSCYLEMDHTQYFDELEPAPSLIQIWDLGVLKSRTTTTPRMVLGIAHDHGNTNSIQWCPSGGYEPFREVPDSQKPPRLGLLAAACSAGFVVIYTVPHPEEEQTICKPDPVITLKPSRLNNWFGQCLCLDWSQKKGHSRIVAGFGNGAVTVWNLHTTSSLLSEEMNGCKYLYPTQVLYACTSFVNAVSLNPQDDNYLLVCSLDRATSMWDLRFPSCPLDEICFCTALDCHWTLPYQLGMVSTESHAINSRGSVVHLFDSGLYNSYFTEMTLHTSVWSFSISDWLHCVAAGADDGKVGISVYTIPGRWTKYKCSSRTKQRIVTEVCIEAKPSRLCDKPTNQQPLSTSEKKEQADSVTEICAQETESCDARDQGSEMEVACSGGERNKENIASQVLAETKVKGHDNVELLNDHGTKSLNTEVANENVSEGSKVRGEKEMRKTEKYNQQSPNQLTSDSKGENQIISNFAETQVLILSTAEEQDNDSQNVTEKEVHAVKFVSKTRETADEADSAKLQESDLDGTKLSNREGKDESISKEGKVKDGKEMKETEKCNQQSSSQLTSNLKGGNQIISNFAETQFLIPSMTEEQENDSQNVTEKEVHAVKFVSKTREIADEADSAKLQESDLSETKSSNREGKDESLSERGKVKDGKEMKENEKCNQQSSSQLTSNLKGGNQIISNFAETQFLIPSMTEEQDNDSQNVTVTEKEVHAVKFVGRTRETADEADSAKLQESDLGETKLSNRESKDESLSERGKVKDGKEMKETEKCNQQSSSQLTSDSKGENQIISNFAETQLLVSSPTEEQENDSQNVTEKEVHAVKFVGKTREIANEADSAKLQESDLDETRLLNEGDIETLGDVADGVENLRRERLQSSDDIPITRKEPLISTISGNSSDSIERNCSNSVDEGNVVMVTNVSKVGKESIDHHKLDNITKVDVTNLDGKKFDDVIHRKDRKDQKLGSLENGVSLRQNGSGDSEEVPMAISVEAINPNSSKKDSESCEMLDENELNESKIESLDSQINELMSTCHSTLEDLKESGTLSPESAVKPSMNDGKASEKKRKQKKIKLEKEVEVPQEKKLCIMDEAFDIRQVVGDSDLTAKDENDSMVEEEKDALRARVRAWKPKYEETEASKFVLYKDYFEPVYASSTWTPISKEVLSRTPDMPNLTNLSTNSTDFLLNAVNKVAWSPNFQSCRWLLVAGNNGIVRAIHMSCLKPSGR